MSDVVVIIHVENNIVPTERDAQLNYIKMKLEEYRREVYVEKVFFIRKNILFVIIVITNLNFFFTSSFLENKPGQCPVLVNGGGSCTAECQTDADCPGPQKCCTANCAIGPMTSCVDPVRVEEPPAVPATTSPPVYQRPFYGGKIFLFFFNLKQKIKFCNLS